MEETATSLANRALEIASNDAAASIVTTNRGFIGKTLLNAHLFSSDAGHVSKLATGFGKKRDSFCRAD